MDKRIAEKVKDLLDKAEELGWNVSKYEDYYTLQHYSPEGQDFSFDVYMDDLGECVDERTYFVDSVYRSYDEYDPSLEAYYWLDDSGHGRNGAPYEMGDVYADMKACEHMMLELWRALREML